MKAVQLKRFLWRVSTSRKGRKAGQFGRVQWDSLKNQNRWNIHIQTTPRNSHARQRRSRRDWNISLSSMIFFRHDLECLYQDMQTQEKKVFYCFYKITFPRKKSKTLLFIELVIKRQILTSRDVLYTKLVRIISLCFAKKMLSKIRFFSRLKCQLKRKKIDTACF